jgi:hypothetical protein
MSIDSLSLLKFCSKKLISRPFLKRETNSIMTIDTRVLSYSLLAEINLLTQNAWID